MTANNRLLAILSTAVFLLAIPAIAMLFIPALGFNWSYIDFITGGVLLFGSGLTIEFVLRKVKTTKYRLIVVGAILIALFLVWAELAVGLFGTSSQEANQVI